MIAEEEFYKLSCGEYYTGIIGIKPVVGIDIVPFRKLGHNIALSIKIYIDEDPDSENTYPYIYYLSLYNPEYIGINYEMKYPTLPDQYKKFINDSIIQEWDKIKEACKDPGCSQCGIMDQCEYYRSIIIPDNPPDYTKLP